MSEAWSKWEGRVVNGEFQLKKYLGGSEQSAVFLADDLVREFKPAAIKLLPSDRSDADHQLGQWRLTQGLSHPHLIRIFRTGRCQLDDRDFIFAVMEYAEENLAQIIPDRALTVQESREMLEPALKALAYLHEQGLVHGCLKPGKVMAINDQLKLASDSVCSAGESKFVSDAPTIYDPPEMADKRRSQAGDMWSLGVTLVEVLTQSLPSWNEKDSADPILPSSLPAPFAEIARGCLRRDPQRRLTIADVAAQLHGKPSQPARAAHATPSLDRVGRGPVPSQKQQPTVSHGISWVWQSAFPGVLAILGIVALLAGFGFLRHQPETQAEVAAVKPEPTPALAPKPDARHRVQARLSSAPESPVNEQPASLPSEVTMRDAGPKHSADVVEQILPQVPQRASETIQGTIRVAVRVYVGPSGNVVEAELDSAGPSKYFARLALETAQRWKFVSSDSGAQREFVLHYQFRSSGTSASAVPTGL